MSSDTIWTALALVLVIEGLFPLVSLAGWRKMFAQLLSYRDGQIRFFGVCSAFSGLLMIWLIAS